MKIEIYYHSFVSVFHYKRYAHVLFCFECSCRPRGKGNGEAGSRALLGDDRTGERGEARQVRRQDVGTALQQARDHQL